MVVKRAVSKVRRFWRWLMGDQDILIEISEAFTVITVINSYLMVYGNHEPKIGRFAYIHLLIRLAIISVVCAIWEGESIFQAIKRRIIKLKNLDGINIKEIYKYVLNNKFASICSIYTVLTIIICLVMIVGVNAPRGGAELYFNLMLLFAFISISIFILYLLEKIKGFQRNRRNGSS